MTPRRMAARSRRKEGRTIGSSSGKRAAATVRLIRRHVARRPTARQPGPHALWMDLWMDRLEILRADAGEIGAALVRDPDHTTRSTERDAGATETRVRTHHATGKHQMLDTGHRELTAAEIVLAWRA